MEETILQRELRRRMVEAGYNQKSLARTAELNETAVRDILKGRSKNPRIDTLEALARTLGCSVTALRGDDDKPGKSDQVERVEVIGALDMGGSDVSMAWPAEFRYAIDIPRDYRYEGIPRFALEVVGRTIEKLYEGRSIAICVRIEDLSRAIKQGERVIVEIAKPREFAIMKYVIDGGDQVWLWPLSDEGEQPMPIRLDAIGFASVKIVALVVGSYRHE